MPASGVKGAVESSQREASVRRVRELEKQVQELERLLKRRYPGASVAALIAVGRQLDASSPVKPAVASKEHVIDDDANEIALLEGRVHKLQTMLDEQAQESARSLRAMEQKFLAIKAFYSSTNILLFS